MVLHEPDLGAPARVSRTQVRSSPTTPAWVVGLDPACTTLREADHLAWCLLESLGAAGVDEPGLLVTTHHVPGPPGGAAHTALAVGLSASPAPRARELVERLLRVCVEHSAAASVTEVGCSTDGEALSGLPVLAAGSRTAAEQQRTGEAGRAVVFSGVGALGTSVTVGQLLATTAVDAVLELGSHETVDPSTLVHTRDHVRPVLREGRLVLDVQPAVGGLVPFENPNPTPCCADH